MAYKTELELGVHVHELLDEVMVVAQWKHLVDKKLK